MKQFAIAGVRALALLAFLSTAPLVSQISVIVNFSGTAIAQNTQAKGQVQLRLDAEKRVIQQVQGKQTVSWQALQGKALIQPGDVVRYTVSAANNSNGSVKNLAINQPIPLGTVYVPNSATTNGSNGTKITYSIDGGRSFVENPTVKVSLANGKAETKPAPVAMYTHVRWNFGASIPAKATVKGIYQVQVR
ncbi:hypothetical protein NUACC21_75540 [Scytonema sp. NUACC21]